MAEGATSAPVDDIAFQARMQPGRLAAVELATDRRWTYGALQRAVAFAVGQLRLHGCVSGDRVACLARNRVGLIVLHHACARLGALFVPLNWRLAPAELTSLLADCAPRLLIGDDSLQRAGLSGLAPQAFDGEADAEATAPIDPDRPSLILYTSGTSGRPKGVTLSEANLRQTAVNFGQLGRVGPDSVFLIDAPMFHIIGLITSVRPAFLQGGAVLVSDAFEPARTLARLADPALAVSHYFCVPQMANRLRADPAFDPAALRRLTALFTGGAPHPAADIRVWLADGIAVADGFGMSEAGTVFGMPPDAAIIAAKAGSVGLATPTMAVRIVDHADADCRPGQAGELWLRGPAISAGYWRRPEETSAAFTADGWFRTGDIARCDQDGFHFIVDRKRDMFISGGENVYPAEIEAALADHPDIAECAVVGLPDPLWGEVGHLALVPRDGARVEHSDIVTYLSSRLARYKLPKATTCFAHLPRTATGKLRKAELRQRLIDANEAAAGGGGA